MAMITGRSRGSHRMPILGMFDASFVIHDAAELRELVPALLSWVSPGCRNCQSDWHN
jgi:hypothetical protein